MPGKPGAISGGRFAGAQAASSEHGNGMLNTISSERLAQALKSACLAEIRAPKPGNVSIYSAGHGMTAQQFEASANAIAAPLTVPGTSVGERILRAVQATQQAVGCNTNLGIV